jgi:hypothetical protein
MARTTGRRARRVGEAGPRWLGASGWLVVAALAGALVGGGSGCDRLDPPGEAVEPLPDEAGKADGEAGEASPEASDPTPSSPTPTPTATPDDAADSKDPAPAKPSEATEEPVGVVAPPATEAGDCPEDSTDELGLVTSPDRAIAGEPLRIIAASLAAEDPLALRIEDEAGKPVAADFTHFAGVPAMTVARLTAPEAGARLQITVGRGGKGLGCREIRVHAGAARGVRPAPEGAVWPVTRRWDAGEEALYSAWVRALFHAPRGAELAYAALHELTSDPERNLLHDHLGMAEDAPPGRFGIYMRPDCADTPYFLRAYFAWKRGLPFGFRICSRGSGGRAPSCGGVRGVLGSPADPPDGKLPGELGVVQKFLRRTLAWGVHTGNGRTAFDDEDTDFYPLVLTRRSLRPGTIYADPYGHIFVVAELWAASGKEPGILYAIDGQPDGSITRKRFWEGNFLWNPDPTLGGSGFKGFRPHLVVGTGDDRTLVAATDAQLRTMSGYGDLGLEQAKLDAAGFYDHMDGLITPGIRDPVVAQEEAIRALHESAKVRVTSVDNGEAHFAKGGGEVAMPEGFSIFETTGAWENFATPARDLRLLIAIDVITGFPAKVARNPTAWGVEAAGGLEAVRERLEKAREALLADSSLAFEYTRSDGSRWTLTLAELVARAPKLEAAYNPNDCPELRWAAPEGSKERSTCRRRAPEDQRRKMAAYRTWFHDRRRPPRGDPGPAVE